MTPIKVVIREDMAMTIQVTIIKEQMLQTRILPMHTKLGERTSSIMSMTIMRVIISMLQEEEEELIMTVSFPAVDAAVDMMVVVEAVEAMTRDAAAEVDMMADAVGTIVDVEAGEGTMVDAVAEGATETKFVVLVQTLEILTTIVGVEVGESTTEDAVAEGATEMKIVVLVQTLEILTTMMVGVEV
jgi:hypothetical protein